MKTAVAVVIFFVSAHLAAQSDYQISLGVHLSGVETQQDLKKFRFGYIPGNTSGIKAVFNSRSKKIWFGGYSDYQKYYAYLVIENDGELMVIRIDDSSWLKKVRVRFKSGYFKLNGNSLVNDDRQKPNLELTEPLDIKIVPDE